MKKRPLVLEEAFVWLRSRFALTAEEKKWLLLITAICWAGLLGRYLYLQRQPPLLPEFEEKAAPAPAPRPSPGP